LQVQQVDPAHWWINIYAHKYLDPYSTTVPVTPFEGVDTEAGPPPPPPQASKVDYDPTQHGGEGLWLPGGPVGRGGAGSHVHGTPGDRDAAADDLLTTTPYSAIPP